MNSKTTITKIETLLKSGTVHNIKLARVIAVSQKVEYDFYGFSELALFLSEHTLFNSNRPVEQLIKELMSYSWLELEARGMTTLPETFGLLFNVRNLHLESNYLSDLPTSFSKLVELQQLHLHKNPLVQFPKVLCQLQNLEQLHLYATQISHLPPEIVELTKLRKLDLRENPIGIPERHKIKQLLPHTEVIFE